MGGGANDLGDAGNVARRLEIDQHDRAGHAPRRGERLGTAGESMDVEPLARARDQIGQDPALGGVAVEDDDVDQTLRVEPCIHDRATPLPVRPADGAVTGLVARTG